jgi:hypothetical protein
MRRDLERRIQAVETARIKASVAEVWIEMANGMMRGPRGELIPREEFEVLRNGVGPTVILPDNGRDASLTEFGNVTSAKIFRDDNTCGPTQSGRPYIRALQGD